MLALGLKVRVGNICQTATPTPLPHLHLLPLLGITPFEFRPDHWQKKTEFLAYVSVMNWDNVINATYTQSACDIFYATVLSMLDIDYPLHAVTVINRDPYFVTSKVKSLLRKCNQLSTGENRNG